MAQRAAEYLSAADFTELEIMQIVASRGKQKNRKKTRESIHNMRITVPHLTDLGERKKRGHQ
jgi:hypothetical protein